jgi:hypothetical protein
MIVEKIEKDIKFINKIKEERHKIIVFFALV